MKQTADQLRAVLDESMPMLQAITDEQSGVKHAPDNWCMKEIIGHLIDSACNNQQKFVRTMKEAETQFTGYEQDFWVSSQHYSGADWQGLLQLWIAYNRHLAYVMEQIPADALNNTIMIEGKGPFTLEFIVQDYVEHLKHHLKEIFPETSFLHNKFQMIY